MAKRSKQTTTSPLNPPASTLAKLGSIIVHAEEATSTNGHEFDWHTFHTLLADPEVQAWLKGMQDLAMLPVKRNK